MGSASMSARSPMARGLLPTRMVPTTPVLPMPVVTSKPHSSSLLATIREVRSSSKPSSGWAWISRRMAVSSADAAAILGSIFMRFWAPAGKPSLHDETRRHARSDVHARRAQMPVQLLIMARPLRIIARHSTQKLRGLMLPGELTCLSSAFLGF
jgi:hypothetical protein